MMNEKQRVRELRNIIRTVSCPNCGTTPGNTCMSKNDGSPIKGVHRGRQLMAFAEGKITQNLEGKGLEVWRLPNS